MNLNEGCRKRIARGECKCFVNKCLGKNKRNKLFSAITKKANNQISARQQTMGEENYKSFVSIRKYPADGIIE